MSTFRAKSEHALYSVCVCVYSFSSSAVCVCVCVCVCVTSFVSKCPSSAHVVVLTHVYLLPLVHSQAHNIPAYYEVTTSYHRNNVCHIIIIIILLLTLWTCCTAIGVTIIPLYCCNRCSCPAHWSTGVEEKRY